MPGSERRRHPRFDVRLGMATAIAHHDIPVTLLNVSVGGFAVESVGALPDDGPIEFVFTTRDGAWSAAFEASRAWVRVEAGSTVTSTGRCLAGYSFVDTASPEARRRIDELMEYAAGVAP